eukprot:UN02328
MMNHSKNVPESYRGSEEDKNARFSWKIGSKLQIYSRSEDQWFDGTIIDRFLDVEGEWLRIVYGKKTKSVQRFNAHIKPSLFSNIKKSKNHPNTKQSFSFDGKSKNLFISSIITSISFHYRLNQQQKNIIQKLNKRYAFR